ncbi:MAG: DUF533 domain-containing protein [Arenicellales bacterium]
MSLVSMLGKMAVGMIVAKGLGKIMGGGSSRGGSTGGGLGDVLGGLMGQKKHPAEMDMSEMGELLGGGKKPSSDAGGIGGLGGILDSLGKQGGQAQGGLKDGFGDLFNTSLRGETPLNIEPSQEQIAELMLRAMISAAKCDDNLDENEKVKLTKQLGDVSADEASFVRKELAAPVDVQSLIRDVPKGYEQQVYLMSLLAIDLDAREEVVYLDKLAKGLNISEQMANEIHGKVNAPVMYS